MNREAFDEWVRATPDRLGRDFTQKKEDGSYFYEWTDSNWQAWQARQPEIDALNDGLSRAIDDVRKFCQESMDRWSEIQKLQAEVRRLRGMLRHTAELTDDPDVRSMVEYQLRPGNSLNAAMKEPK